MTEHTYHHVQYLKSLKKTSDVRSDSSQADSKRARLAKLEEEVVDEEARDGMDLICRIHGFKQV